MKKFTGRCLCEAISYEITGELGSIYHCHCSKCRRWQGAAFRTRAAVPVKNFKWITGEHLLSKYPYSDRGFKTFCSICGSCLITEFKNSDFIGLPLGGIEQDPGNRPLGHIFVESKAPWYEITDHLPQYPEWPPGGSMAVRTSND